MTCLPRALPVALCALLLPITNSSADEGQWQPHQLLQLKTELKQIGITIPAEKLADLGKPPMSAIISTGGCSASFVSPQGLVVTNHHCAYGAIQRNSTAERNLLATGFLANTRAEELAAGPNERIYVTDRVENVTDKILKGLDATLTGKSRLEAIQTRIKALIADCEKDPAYRCSVPSFHRGLEYYRIRQLMIRDVRLVYAPAEMIGNYGGDIDNFEWPRHTGDFSFLRAYVGKDGKPADPSPDNVPYQSKDFLVVSAEGLKNGDPILLAGYPGRTNRYKLPNEIRFARDIDYPARVQEYEADLAVIAAATGINAEWPVRYASTVKSINNRMKKLQGLLDGFARKDIAAIKDKQDLAFRSWLGKQKDAESNQQLLNELDELIAADQVITRQEFAFSKATGSELLRAAMTLHRLAKESQKPDAEREPGYQDRDVPFIRARLSRLEQSLVAQVDFTRWQASLKRYYSLPIEDRIQGFDQQLPNGSDLDARLTALYRGTELADTSKRLGWIGQPLSQFENSKDGLIRLAALLYDTAMALEDQRKEIDGEFDRLTPRYMQAVIAWKKSQGKPVYPDANSTLRISYGSVGPYSPVDGISKGPFTTVEGVLAKHRAEEPFNVPLKLQEAIKAGRYGPFRDPVLKTVPVNFLSSADTTGGNSGSAVMNARGELVGLNFDSTYESITKDWYFDPAITRAIHVDIRYMLWIMQEVDHADNLLKEMTIKYPKAP
ncbi:S46 family peptidase [Permianibacter sp. IMCC34836]|uniref:S46 family peptidase n=1 Tax=Permianibacter fluminis TaxID=2738515 RepID=UPI0015537DE5|nr:S46 family peptidase [Permianibacter fluminis]NQD37589.1 S46 family peptidase [Permianibacter fluminis]